MILNIWYHLVVYCLDVFDHKIGSNINMHGLFYKNTYPPPTPVVLPLLKTLYPGIRISSFFMYSCKQVSLTQKCQNCFIYNTPNFINFRIKTSGVGCCFLLKLEYYSSEIYSSSYLIKRRFPLLNFYLNLTRKQKFTIVMDFYQVKLSQNEDI